MEHISKVSVKRIISEALKHEFTIGELLLIANIITTGGMVNVFPEAIDKAIESKRAELAEKVAAQS